MTRRLEEIEVYRAANQLIQQHGDDAQIEAARLADAMLAKGDLEGQRVWKRVLKAIDVLQSKELPKDAPLQ